MQSVISELDVTGLTCPVTGELDQGIFLFALNILRCYESLVQPPDLDSIVLILLRYVVSVYRKKDIKTYKKDIKTRIKTNCRAQRSGQDQTSSSFIISTSHHSDHSRLCLRISYLETVAPANPSVIHLYAATSIVYHPVCKLKHFLHFIFLKCVFVIASAEGASNRAELVIYAQGKKITAFNVFNKPIVPNKGYPSYPQ
ncbi:hypothetical protein BDB01DRAFT_834733 [Pilobolus umbonatus]|nr:hypothetical protein BDB01DRAFT_834733 [Pilobolus umbonatus]